MKILIADKFEATGIERLQSLGCDVAYQPDLAGERLVEAVSEVGPEILIVRSTKVSAEVLDRSPTLSAVIRAGAGYDTIDVAHASDRGIFVCNCPGKNSIAVAELAWGLILSCDRRIPDQVADLRHGRWKKKEYAKAAGLYGRTLGVLGLGRIGMEVASRGRAFGMNVIAWSRSLTEGRATELGLGYCATPIELAKHADVISVHVASNASTKHLVDKAFCDAMKPGAYFINTSRGAVVDEQALRDAIREKGIRAGLDVYEKEPGSGDDSFENSIVLEPGVYGTHHVGASTDQAQKAIADEATRIVEHYIRTGHLINCVNVAGKTSATTMLSIRMKNQPGVLAHVFYILGQAGVNVEEMNNVVYEGQSAACANIAVDEPPDEDQLTAIRANQHVISVACSML